MSRFMNHASIQQRIRGAVIFLFSALGLIVLCVQGEAAPQERGGDSSSGDLTQVTILSDRAEVTRVKKLSCQTAKSGIVAEFSALPYLVQVKTLRAEVTGPANVIGVTHSPPRADSSKDMLKTEEDEELKRAQRKAYETLRSLQTERSRLRGVLDRLRVEAGLINEAVTQGLRSGQLDVKAMRQNLDAQNTSRRVAILRLFELKKEEETAQKVISILDQRERDQTLKQAIALQKSGGEANVSMTCKEAGTIKVALTYVTSGVSWSLDYRVSVNTSSARQGEIEWAVNAVIRQMTGEDWRDVNLTLSTAMPNLGDRAPLPNAVHIGVQPKPKLKILSQRTEDRSPLQSGGGAVSESTRRQSVSIEDRGQSFGLQVPQKVTLISSGEPYWVPVSVSKGKAKLRLVSTPKLSSYVFKVAQFKNPASHPLPRGQMSLNVNGEFQGKISSDYYGIGEPIELTLGVEEGLRVSRELDLNKDKEVGLLEGRKSLLRRFKIKLKSSSKETQRIELTENLPVSEVEDIRVTLNKTKTSTGFKYQPQTGLLTWDLKLKPLKSRELTFAYEVNVPKSWQVK